MGKPEYPEENIHQSDAEKTLLILVLMRVSLPSKLRKTKQPFKKKKKKK